MSKPDKIPNSIWAIGLATLLLNVSSVIVFGLSAVYMKTILGIGSGWIGFLEGTVEACAYLMKLLSGVLSDYLKRRKVIMVWGFALAVLSRPLLAAFSSFGTVLAARLLDRLGNGLQSTPRDALVGDIAPHGMKGKCYGLRQSMATAGSFLGGILGIIVMIVTQNNYPIVFWIASIPAVLALIILIVMVKEPTKTKEEKSEERQPIHLSDIPLLGRPYWILMGITIIFMSARVSEAMLILHAHQNFELSARYIPFVLILYNGANSLISYPIGYLSDKMPRHYLLTVGFGLLLVADLLLGMAQNLTMVLFGVIVWGFQIGITQSMFMALIADLVPAHLRGTGFGFFYLISAVALVIAGSAGGMIAQYYGEHFSFFFSLTVGSLAFILLLIFGKYLNKPVAALLPNT